MTHINRIQDDINKKQEQLCSIDKYLTMLKFSLKNNDNDKNFLREEIQKLSEERLVINMEIQKLFEETIAQKHKEEERIRDNINSIDAALQTKYHWMADIEYKTHKLSIEEIFDQSDNYNKLKKEFCDCKNEIKTLQNTLYDLKNELKEEKRKPSPLKMSDDEEKVAKIIVEQIKSLMDENFPGIKAIVSTNIDTTILTLTEKPSSPDLIVKIGDLLNLHVNSDLCNVVNTNVIVTVGQEIGYNHDNQKNEDTNDIVAIVNERFKYLVESGQIPKDRRKILISVERERLKSSIQSIKENGEIIIYGLDYGSCNIGDIAVLCTEDGRSFISSPFIVLDQSINVFNGVCNTILKKIDVRKVW